MKTRLTPSCTTLSGLQVRQPCAPDPVPTPAAGDVPGMTVARYGVRPSASSMPSADKGPSPAPYPDPEAFRARRCALQSYHGAIPAKLASRASAVLLYSARTVPHAAGRARGMFAGWVWPGDKLSGLILIAGLLQRCGSSAILLQRNDASSLQVDQPVNSLLPVRCLAPVANTMEPRRQATRGCN